MPQKKTIPLKIQRDDLRLVANHFLPYLQKYCEMKVDGSKQNLEDHLNAITILSLFTELRHLIGKKLSGKPNRWTIPFKHHHAVTFYKLMINFPVPVEQTYMLQARTAICDQLLKQFNDPTKQLT